MQDLTKLAELATKLTGEQGESAVALVERMGEVIEGFGDKPQEWRPDIMKLVQGTSDRSKLPKGANIGAFVLGEEVLEQPFPVIVLRLYTSRQYWDPNPENAKMICNSPDGQVGWQYGDCRTCAFAKFDEENNRSQCNKTLTMLCVSLDMKKVFTVNFSKTNFMNGRDWETLMRKAGVAPYKRIYTLSSMTSTKSKNVELIKAEPTKDNRVEGALLDFVTELFRISGDDRKEMLLKFHEYAKTKKENQAALAAPADVVLIGDETQGSEPQLETVTDVEVKEEAPKSKAPKYKM